MEGETALPAPMAGRAVNGARSVTFAGVKLAITDVSCGADGCALRQRPTCDGCRACADGCAAQTLFADGVATCGKTGCRAKRENDVTN